MFGLAPVRKQELNADGHLVVQSVFSTIQGEGPFVGVPAIFVRLAGCNLRCKFCDTEYESAFASPTESKPVSPKDLVQRVKAAIADREIQLVVLTGGEPLRQNVLPFFRELLRTISGVHVQIETAGTLWIDGLEDFLVDNVSAAGLYLGVSIVVSPKTAKAHPKIAEYAHWWKYIVRKGQVGRDGLPIVSTQLPGAMCILARPKTGTRPSRIYVQPCEEYKVAGDGSYTPDQAATHANVELAKEISQQAGYRLSLQTHKLLGLE